MRSVRYKNYELKDHLGNVRATISDIKKHIPPIGPGPGGMGFVADLRSYQNYYAFGMLQPGRSWSGDSSRYGYNGKEKDNEVKGSGNEYDYGFRIYDPRIARFLSEDPLTPEYPWYSPYQFAGNMPIWAVDIDGREPWLYTWRLDMDANEKLHMVKIGARNLNMIWRDPGMVTSSHDYLLRDHDVHVLQTGLRYTPEIYYQYEGQIAEFVRMKNAEPPPAILSTLVDLTPLGTVFDVMEIAFGTSSDKESHAAIVFLGLAGGKIIISGKRVVDATSRFLLKREGKFFAGTLTEIWRKLGGTARGSVLEVVLASTRYAAKYEWVGKLYSGTYKTIDFWANGLGVSLKTTNSVGGFKDILDNLDALALMRKAGKAQDGRRITSVRLDIMVPEGYDQGLLAPVRAKAKKLNIPVEIFDRVER
jgi:RHS repeat-associated protein